MASARCLTHLFAAVVLAVAATCTSIPPLVLPPSLGWDGDDGQWSTFSVELGSPGQAVRLLPGTSAEASTIFWVVVPEGCTDVNPTLANCADNRGRLFQSNLSTTWSTQGLSNTADGAIYSLVAVQEGHLGLAGNASYGFDTVSLGLGQSGLPVLHNQVVAGLWTNDFFLGVLPLSPLPFNFSFDQPTTSMLGQLRNQSMIPSLSWAYTAGAFYASATTNRFASLTLGGYDATRLAPNNVSFSFGADYTRDLILTLDAITYSTESSAPLLTGGNIVVYIDSLVSELWLPVDVCQRSAKSFNLTYHDQGNRYLVSDDAHTALLRENPVFTFSFSNGDGIVDIALPYAAFDLNLTAPIVGNLTRYFPIRQAQDEPQYTLGRAFLQAAYVIADYERRNFSVSQAVYPSTSVAASIVPIHALSDGKSAAGNDTLTGSATLTGGAIAGIVIGSIVPVVIVVVAFLWRRKRMLKHSMPGSSGDGKVDVKSFFTKPWGLELDAQDSSCHELAHLETELPTNPRPLVHEMAEHFRYELRAEEWPHELADHIAEPVELAAR